MRIVDADALKTKAETIQTIDCWHMRTEEQAVLVEHIDTEPTIDAVPHWIPCEERMPNEEGEYLVSMTWVTMPEFKEVMVLDYRPNAGFETINAYRADAWMPLPEPYEGERKDDEEM